MTPTPSTDSQPNHSAKNDYALLSTTTTLSKLRGFTLEALKHLKTENLTSWQLAEKAEKPTVYVNVYLFRLQKYGLASKHEDFWFLTKEGTSFLNLIETSNNRNNTTITREQHNNNTTITRNQSKVPKQVTISLWLQDTDRNEAEKEVVEVLVKHYNETGSKFLYFTDVYQFAHKFKIRPDQVNTILMNLKQDRVVYSIKDKQHNAWKIGLYKAFVEGLKTSQGVT